MKKHTLPSSDTNRNNPVRLWYKMPLFLLANAPNAKILAADLLPSLSMIMFGPG